MSDIFKQIQELQEKFNNLYRTKDGEVGFRFVDGTPQFKAVFQGPDVPKLHRLTDLERARKAQEYRMKHSVYDPEEGMIYDPPEEEKKPEKPEKPKARVPEGTKKMNDNNSYNEIITQIMDLKEQFDNLFEVEGLGDPAVDVPPSQNKIKKDRKTKDGKVEVVSVEDELFPYEGNKREQFRQKILDTINNMIQGTATLEDLMQIVRQKKAPLKEAMELMEDLLDKRTKNEKGMEATRKRSDHGAPYRDYINHKELYPHNQGITGNEEKDLKREAKGLYKAIDHYNTWNKEHGYNPHPGSYITGLKCDLAKVKNTLKQINNYKKYGKHEALEEALSLMEAIIKEATPLETKRRIANQFKNKMDSKLGAAHQEVNKALDRMNGLSKKIRKQGGDTVIVTGDKIENFHNDPEVRKNQVAFNKATDDMHNASKKEHKIHHLRNLVDFYKTDEALKEALNLLLEYTEADKKKAAKKVLDDRKREYLSKYANVLDAADIDGSDNVPDGDMKDLERAEKRYKHAKKVANEAFEEALKILELFDRPDLLNDIDTAVGSPVKKAFKKAMSSIAAPKKEKKVKECKK